MACWQPNNIPRRRESSGNHYWQTELKIWKIQPTKYKQRTKARVPRDDTRLQDKRKGKIINVWIYWQNAYRVAVRYEWSVQDTSHRPSVKYQPFTKPLQRTLFTWMHGKILNLPCSTNPTVQVQQCTGVCWRYKNLSWILTEKWLFAVPWERLNTRLGNIKKRKYWNLE